MQSDDPPYLTVGTEVSAKFKGAFCEAKIKKVTKSVKCKIQLKEHPYGSVTIEHPHIKSDNLELNQMVDFVEGKTIKKGMIQTIKDCSTYHVVFNDGDEKTLRRTQMCLKGARHFDEKVSLDALPLYNPEQWINNPELVRGTEIMPKEMVKKYKKRKMEESSPSKSKRRKEKEESDDELEKKKMREKRAAASAATVAIGEMGDQGDTEISCDGSSSGDASDVEKEKEKDRKKVEMEKKEKSVAKSPAEPTFTFATGDVICCYDEMPPKGKWLPGVVVSRRAYRNSPKASVLMKKELAIRLFTNSQYVRVAPGQLTMFKKQKITSKDLEGMDSTLKTAVDKAKGFADKQTLPSTWKRAEIFDEDEAGPSKEKDEKKKDVKKEEKIIKKEEEDSELSESSDDEPVGEEADLFVAQLYKYQEDRGTPINRVPVLGGREIDMYRFYRCVEHYGGQKKVKANGDWKKVMVRMKLEGCPGATPVTIKNAYSRYLQAFAIFYKDLGSSWTQSTGTGTASPRDGRRLLMRGPTDEQKKKKTVTKPGEKESTVEKESSVESKDDRKEKKETEKKEPEKKEKEREKKEPPKKEVKPEKIERSHSISEKEKKEKEEVKDKAKEPTAGKKEEKKDERKKDEKRKPERKKEDSESTEQSEKDKKEVVSKPGPSVEQKDKKDKKEKKEEPEPLEPDTEAESSKKKVAAPKYAKGPKGVVDNDPDGEYKPADCFTQFYLGQKVRAYHLGKWYDARVIGFDYVSAKEMTTFLKKYEESQRVPWLPDELCNYLRKCINDAKVFVHYLGWNSRYDENITLAKIKASSKDQEHGMAQFRLGNCNGIFLQDSFLQKLSTWVRGCEGIGLLKKETEEAAKVCGMGGYRPRRVSVSQYEQIEAAARQRQRAQLTATPRSSSNSISSPPPSAVTEEEARPSGPAPESEKKKESSVTKNEAVSVASSTRSATPAAELKKESEKDKTPKELTPVSSPKPKRQRTISTNSSTRTISPAIQAAAPAVPTPPPTRSISPPKPLTAPTKKSSRTTSISEDAVQMPPPAKSPEKKIEPKEEVKAEVLGKTKSPEHAKLKKTPAFEIKEPLDEEKEELEMEEFEVPEPSGEEEVVEEIVKEEVVEEEIVEELMIGDMQGRSMLIGIAKTDAGAYVEENKQELEDEHFDQLEIEAKTLLETTREESDTGSSPTTPTQDAEILDDTVSPHVISPAKNVRGQKRKRQINSRHSQMVVDKKYTNKKKDKVVEENSEEDDEDYSWIKRKNIMYKQLEADGTLNDCSCLGIVDIGILIEGLSPEEQIPIIEKRQLLLREIHANAKREIALLEKQRKAHKDKKREERDKERQLAKEGLSSSASSSIVA